MISQKNRICILSPLPNDDIIKKEQENDVNNKPFLRHKNILDIFLKNKDTHDIMIYNTVLELAEQKLLELEMYDKNYLTFLKNAYSSFVTAGKPAEFLSDKVPDGLVSYITHRGPINKNHLNSLPFWLQTGMYGNDTFTPIFSHTYETALISAYNGIYAADLLSKYDTIYLIHPFPGHHATLNSFSGYCFINNIAVCVENLIQKKVCKKVALLDLDFHHGDGTQQIFYGRKDVVTYSIHGDPSREYPFYSGYVDEVGEGEGKGANYNFPLKGGVTVDKYLAVLETILANILTQNVDVLAIAVGGDTFVGDKEVAQEARFLLELEHYKKIGQLIRKYWKGKIVVSQEGGYSMEFIAQIIYNFVSSLS